MAAAPLSACEGRKPFVYLRMVFDLQFRLWSKGCNRRSGFRITIFDSRTRGDNSKPRLERVVVAGEDSER